jgi:hypothetical protein
LPSATALCRMTGLNVADPTRSISLTGRSVI